MIDNAYMNLFDLVMNYDPERYHYEKKEPKQTKFNNDSSLASWEKVRTSVRVRDKLPYNKQEKSLLDNFFDVYEKIGDAGLEMIAPAYFADEDTGLLIQEISGTYLKNEPLLADKDNFSDIMLPTRYDGFPELYATMILAIMIRCTLLGSAYSTQVLKSLCRTCKKEEYSAVKRMHTADFDTFMSIYGSDNDNFLRLRSCDPDESNPYALSEFYTAVSTFYIMAKCFKKELVGEQWNLISAMIYLEEEAYYEHRAYELTDFYTDYKTERNFWVADFSNAKDFIDSVIVTEDEDGVAPEDLFKKETHDLIQRCFLDIKGYYSDVNIGCFTDQIAYLAEPDLMQSVIYDLLEQTEGDLMKAGLDQELHRICYALDVDLADLAQSIEYFKDGNDDIQTGLIILAHCIVKHITQRFIETYVDMRADFERVIGIPFNHIKKMEQSIADSGEVDAEAAKILTGQMVDDEYAKAPTIDDVIERNYRVKLFLEEFAKIEPQKQTEGLNKENKPIQTKGASPLPEEIKSLEEENETLKEKVAYLEQRLKRSQSQTEAQRQLYEQARDENKELQQILMDTEKQLQALEKENAGTSEVNTSESPLPSNEEILAMLGKEKVIFVGGHENWVKKLKQLLPEWEFVGRRGNMTTLEGLSHADEVFIYTDSLAHSLYNKVISVIKRAEVPYYFVHSLNIDNLIREMYNVRYKQN